METHAVDRANAVAQAQPSSLPTSFASVEVDKQAVPSELESSWAGVLDFTQSQSTSKQPSVSAASTGMGSDWQVLKLSQDECSSSPRSLPDSLPEACHPDVLADGQYAGEESSGCSSQSKPPTRNLYLSGLHPQRQTSACPVYTPNEKLCPLQNEEMADLLLRSTDLQAPSAFMNDAVTLQEHQAAPAGDTDPTMDGPLPQDAPLLDLDSFEAVKAQAALSSEGSLDGYSEASFPPSPRCLKSMDASELELEVELPEAAALAGGVWGLLCQLVDSLQAGAQAVQHYLLMNAAHLSKALRSGTLDATTCLDAVLPASLRQSLLKLRMALRKQPSNWTVIMLSTSVAALAAMLLASYASNNKMARQLQQKDRELARLVVKIFSLQDMLQNPRHTPLIRQTHMPTVSVHPLF